MDAVMKTLYICGLLVISGLAGYLLVVLPVNIHNGYVLYKMKKIEELEQEYSEIKEVAFKSHSEEVVAGWCLILEDLKWAMRFHRWLPRK